LVKATVKVASHDNSKELMKAVRRLTKMDVLVGVPQKSGARKRSKVNNAMLAYIHDNGSPLSHIPPRPFLRTGIQEGKKEIVHYLDGAAKGALNGDPEAVEKGLNAAGLVAQKSVRRKIQTGPFTPLKASTIRARRSKRKSRNNNSITPLIDTGQMRNSINYVIRKKT
jgi:hypothetical protein